MIRHTGTHKMSASIVHKPDKGKWRGSCNRETCQEPDAYYFNAGVGKYYCKRCALKINELNDETICTPVGQDPKDD